MTPVRSATTKKEKNRFFGVIFTAETQVVRKNRNLAM